MGTKGYFYLGGAAVVVFAALGILIATLSRPATSAKAQTPQAGSAFTVPGEASPPAASGQNSAPALSAPVLSAAPVSLDDMLNRRQAFVAPPAVQNAPAPVVQPAPAIPAAPPPNPNLSPDQQLLQAMTQGNLASIADAVQRGANVNPVDTSQGTPLLWAVTNGDYALLENFLSRGANVNARLITGETALMAAPAQKTLFVKRLLEAGADASARSKDDDTPLLAACRYANVEAATMLVNAGADPRIKNKRGETALALAMAGSLITLVPLLHQAGATE